MKLIGSPGTLSSLCLRFTQSLLAALALIFSVLNPDYYVYTVFRGLTAASTILMVWGLGLFFYDIHIRRCRNHRLQSRLLTLLVIGDWLVGGITLAAVSSSTAVMMFFGADTNQCFFQPFPCKMGATSVIFAYIGWVCIAITALILLWIRASV